MLGLFAGFSAAQMTAENTRNQVVMSFMEMLPGQGNLIEGQMMFFIEPDERNKSIRFLGVVVSLHFGVNNASGSA